MLVLRVNDLQNLSDEATLELRVVRQSHFLQIVVESPPHVVKEKAEELAKVLGQFASYSVWQQFLPRIKPVIRNEKSRRYCSAAHQIVIPCEP